tara:strand:- start:43 stop:384 length:342 start_codon:yes stop_codon:yes gene_type:complete
MSPFYKYSIVALIITLIICPYSLSAIEVNNGKNLFLKHCSGCHVNGGNIIRRNKTLRLSALERRGLDNSEEIAKIARLGIGIMNGYKEVLKEGEDQIIGKWVLEQAQNAWTHG